jgi:hypothetical protein
VTVFCIYISEFQYEDKYTIEKLNFLLYGLLPAFLIVEKELIVPRIVEFLVGFEHWIRLEIITYFVIGEKC